MFHLHHETARVISRQRIQDRLTCYFEPARSSGRIVEFEGFRGIAALMVFWVHFGSLFCHYAGSFGPVVMGPRTLGLSGVDLFFLLSGYLIYAMALRKEISFLEFVSKRVQRIYPSFLAVFGLYLVLSLVFPQESRIPTGRLEAISYAAANLLLLPGVFAIHPLVTVTWSLSYQVMVYIAFPVLVWRLTMRNWSPKARVVFWASWGLMAVALPTPLLMFAAGPIVHECRHTPAFRIRWRKLGLALSALLMLAPLVGQTCSLPVPLTSIARFAGYTLLVATVLTNEGCLQSLLRWTPLRWLGNMSYSFYLMHGVTLLACRWAMARLLDWTPDAYTLMGLCLTLFLPLALLTSAALFHLVERRYSILPRPRPVMRTGWLAPVFHGSGARIAAVAPQGFHQ